MARRLSRLRLITTTALRNTGLLEERSGEEPGPPNAGRSAAAAPPRLAGPIRDRFAGREPNGGNSGDPMEFLGFKGVDVSKLLFSLGQWKELDPISRRIQLSQLRMVTRPDRPFFDLAEMLGPYLNETYNITGNFYRLLNSSFAHMTPELAALTQEAKLPMLTGLRKVLIAVRHGQSIVKKAAISRIQGHSEIAFLSDVGILQAMFAGEYVKRLLHLSQLRVHTFWGSYIQRAQETLSIVKDMIGTFAPIRLEDGALEIDKYGPENWGQDKEALDAEKLAEFTQKRFSRAHAFSSTSETFEDVICRTTPLIEAIHTVPEGFAEGRTPVEVLVAHGGIIKFILFLLLHRKAGRIPHPEEWRLFMETTKIRNASVSIVGQTAQGEWRIFMLNNAEFMPRFPGDLKDPRGAETEPVVSEMRDGPAMGIADLMDWLRRQHEEAEGRWAPRLDAVLPDGDRLRLLSQHLSIQTPAAS